MSNSQAPSTVSQSTASSMAPAVTSRKVLSRVKEPSLEISWEYVVGKPISGPHISRLAASTTATTAARVDQV